MEGNNTGYLCFRVLLKYLKVSVSDDIKATFSSYEDECLAMLGTAQKMHLKARLGKINRNTLLKSTIPVIAERKDGSFILLLEHDNSEWYFFDPSTGETRKEADETVISD